MFLVREVEGSLAQREHLRLDREQMTVTWQLPVSKTDPEARGCERTWGCTCLDGEPDRTRCPYHAAERHLEILVEKFGLVQQEEDVPLFPRQQGRRSKHPRWWSW